jgi:predicted ester cyclase
MDTSRLLASGRWRSFDSRSSAHDPSAGSVPAAAISQCDLKARARRLAEELLTQGDLSVADEIVSRNCVHHAPVRIARGPAGLSRWVVALRNAFPDLYAIIEEEIAEGLLLAQLLTVSGTQIGPFCRLQATGRHVTWRVLVLMRAAPDGRLEEHWSSWDRLR